MWYHFGNVDEWLAELSQDELTIELTYEFEMKEVIVVPESVV